jgi:hypothetical protein
MARGKSQSPIYRGRIYRRNRFSSSTIKTTLHRGRVHLGSRIMLMFLSQS